jgi:hypothetical protein
VRAVPAILEASEGGSPQVASWLVPLWLLCVVFMATAAWEAHRHIHHYEGSRHWVMVSTIAARLGGPAHRFVSMHPGYRAFTSCFAAASGVLATILAAQILPLFSTREGGG